MATDGIPLAKLQDPQPFWDLFEQFRAELQERRVALTLDQYDWLRQAIWVGTIATWPDLGAVCAVLWVKPSDGDWQRLLFDRLFADYQRAARVTIEPEMPQKSTPTKKPEPETQTFTKGQMPPLPLRPMPQGDREVLGAVQTTRREGRSTNGTWKFNLHKLPISELAVKESWRAWRRLRKRPLEQAEVDVERTVAQISPLGWIEAIAWQGATDRRANLVVLVDEGENMQTYLPALGKLFGMIEQRRITPAEIYRFTGYPWRFLYRWRQPNKAVVAEDVLKRLQADRTILLVVSDAGAAIGFNDPDRVRGTLEFLERWQPSIRPILWLNPVPEERWVGTPAAEIQQVLGGRMITPEQFNGLFMRRLMAARSWQA